MNGPLILVVDDDPANLQSIQNVLELDYELILAESGQIALDLMEKKRPDLVLLDISMPIMDGYEVCGYIKAHPIWRFIPLVFMTAFDREENQTLAGATGADGYLVKPLDVPILKRTIETQLRIKFRVDEIIRLYEGLKKDQEVARTAQEKLLTPIPETPFAKIYKIFQPYGEDQGLKYVSGDFFHFHFDGNRLDVLLGDATGHGTLASFITLMTRVALQQIIMQKITPELFMQRLNQILIDALPEHCFITAMYCSFNRDSHTMTFTNAGHPEALIFSQHTPPKRLLLGGCPLGSFDIPFDVGSIELQKGDKVFLYTDGVAESRNSNKEMFGTDRIETYLDECKTLPLEEWMESFKNYLNEFMGEEFYTDDLTMIGIEMI